MTNHEITQYVPPLINNIPLRFFSCDYDLYDEDDPFFDPTEEITQEAFMRLADAGWFIGYERHTVRENGVSQVCLTATPYEV